MNNDELNAVFEQQAAGYDKQLARMAAINHCLYFMLETIFAALSPTAKILCVGVGTGKELIHLAKRFPQWTFTAVEPSSAMLDICRQNVEAEGLTARCNFHEGYLSSLPNEYMYDAATCFLVSHFILDPEARSEFFGEIANRLQQSGILACSDLSSGANSDTYDDLLRVWQSITSADPTPENLHRMKAAYAKDVAMLPSIDVAKIIQAGSFDVPVQFFQAGLIHAWYAKKSSAISMLNN